MDFTEEPGGVSKSLGIALARQRNDPLMLPTLTMHSPPCRATQRFGGARMRTRSSGRSEAPGELRPLLQGRLDEKAMCTPFL